MHNVARWDPPRNHAATIEYPGKPSATAASARMLFDAGAPASSALAVSPALLPRSASESSPPAWVELILAGIFHGRDGRGPFKLADPEALITATEALKMQAGIPIDYDHATEFAAPQGRPAPAAGWIRELAARDARSGAALTGRQAPPRRERRGSMLSQTETAICAQLGLKHSDFLKRKHGGADFLRIGGDVSES